MAAAVGCGSAPEAAIVSQKIPVCDHGKDGVDSEGSRQAEPEHGRWRLANITEHRIFSAGVQCLHAELVLKKGSKEASRAGGGYAFEMPRRADGTTLVMQASLFRRLLNGEVELKGCMESDVSAAQMDLRLLSTEQLLVIRARNLGLLSTSTSHTAHCTFLELLDMHLAEKLLRQLLRGRSPAKAGPMRALGRRLILALGAAELLAEGWGQIMAESQGQAYGACSGIRGSSGCVEVPARWALELDAMGWPGRRAALFHTKEFWVEIPAGDQCPELSWRSVRGPVAAVCDSSSGGGRNVKFRWDVQVLHPARGDDVGAAVTPALDGAASQQLAKELVATLEQRCQVMGVPRPLRSEVIAQCGPRDSGPAARGDAMRVSEQPDAGTQAAASAATVAAPSSWTRANGSLKSVGAPEGDMGSRQGQVSIDGTMPSKPSKLPAAAIAPSWTQMRSSLRSVGLPEDSEITAPAPDHLEIGSACKPKHSPQDGVSYGSNSVQEKLDINASGEPEGLQDSVSAPQSWMKAVSSLRPVGFPEEGLPSASPHLCSPPPRAPSGAPASWTQVQPSLRCVGPEKEKGHCGFAPVSSIQFPADAVSPAIDRPSAMAAGLRSLSPGDAVRGQGATAGTLSSCSGSGSHSSTTSPECSVGPTMSPGHSESPLLNSTPAGGQATAPMSPDLPNAGADGVKDGAALPEPQSRQTTGSAIRAPRPRKGGCNPRKSMAFLSGRVGAVIDRWEA
jgi:hypothetical protein